MQRTINPMHYFEGNVWIHGLRKTLGIPLSCVYGAASFVVHAYWNLGVASVECLNVPTISIGSLFAGGSGKTPVTAYLASRFTAHGYSPLILTRGYRRRSKEPVFLSGETKDDLSHFLLAGDEATWLHETTRAPVAIHRRREIAFRTAEQQTKVDLVLLDDGFQYRRLARDVDIVLIDGVSWSKHRHLIPMGNRREPYTALKRAHGVVLTKTEEGLDKSISEALGPWWKGPIFPLHLGIRELIPAVPCSLTRKVPAPGDELCAVASIAFPSNFFDQLDGMGYRVVRTWTRGDHKPWNPRDAARLRQWAKDFAVVTTPKDWVSLRAYSLDVPVYIANYGVLDNSMADNLWAFIWALVQNRLRTNVCSE